MNSLKEKARKIYVINIPGGVYAVPFSKILYVEYYDHRLIVNTTDGKSISSVSCRQSFSSLITPLTEEERFVQTSSSCIINMQHVRKFTAKEFKMANGKMIPITRVYTNARSIYMDYILG